MAPLKILASMALVAAIVILVLKLALAPLHSRYDVAECREAYARARTRADTARVDLHLRSGKPNHRRCGAVRATVLDATSGVLASTRPDEEL